MILGSFSFLFHLGLILKIYIAKITINFIEIKKFINTLLSFFFFCLFHGRSLGIWMFIGFSCNLKNVSLL